MTSGALDATIGGASHFQYASDDGTTYGATSDAPFFQRVLSDSPTALGSEPPFPAIRRPRYTQWHVTGGDVAVTLHIFCNPTDGNYLTGPGVVIEAAGYTCTLTKCIGESRTP